MQVWLQRIPLLLFFITIFSFSLRYLSDHDLGFHLKGGQWIWEHKAVPDKDTYTYTVNQNDYIDSHWLFQLVVWGFYSLAGYSGVSLLVAILITVIFYIQWKLLRTYISITEGIVLLMLVALIIQFRFHLRPELITWMCISLYLLVYQTYLKKKSNAIYWLFFVQLIWANCHGLFILGWLMCAAFFISDWWHTKSIDKRLLLVGALQPVAALITPYGIKGLLFPFYLYTRLQEGNVMNNAISEFKSVFEIQTTPNSPFSPGILYYGFGGFVVLFLISFIFSLKNRKVFEWIIGCAFLFLAIKAIRNIPLFLFVGAPFIAAAWFNMKIRERLVVYFSGYTALFRSIVAYSLMLFLLLLWNNGYYKLNRNGIKTGLGLNTLAYPVGTGNFINSNQLSGKLINDFNTGSWLEWQLAQPVFIDGRLEVMREEFFAEYQNSQTPDSLKNMLNKYQPELILFDYMSSGSWHIQLNKLKEDWRMIFADEVSVLYMKKGYREEFQPFSFRLFLVRQGINNELTQQQKWEILRMPLQSTAMKLKNALTGRLNYPFDELMKPGIFAYRNKEFKVAERLYLEFIKRSEGGYYEAFVNLGSLYTQTGETDKAMFCMQKALTVDAGNPIILNKIKQLREQMNKKYRHAVPQVES
ncbi:MAG: tetratricopeptide repeat protein [Bacteroidia bacterium]